MNKLGWNTIFPNSRYRISGPRLLVSMWRLSAARSAHYQTGRTVGDLTELQNTTIMSARCWQGKEQVAGFNWPDVVEAVHCFVVRVKSLEEAYVGLRGHHHKCAMQLPIIILNSSLIGNSAPGRTFRVMPPRRLSSLGSCRAPRCALINTFQRGRRERGNTPPL